MSESQSTVLVAEPDERLRSLLVHHLTPLGYDVVQAADGDTALRHLSTHPASVVLCELYLTTTGHPDLIQAIRSNKSLVKTRVIAHTRRASPRDRDWATSAGADAFLIYPTRAERLRYVVGRLASEKGTRRASTPATSPVVRRRSLDKALQERENGGPTELSTIVVGKTWWSELGASSQSSYRKRAKNAGVTLRSDVLLGSDYVIVRKASRKEKKAVAATPASPYKQPSAQA